MKIDRMLGIVTHLMRNERATAGELAERFEVSRRTILRDVDTLCAAGIPIVTAQGTGGGITIAEGYRVRENVLTEGELRSVLAGVMAMDSIEGTQRGTVLREKLPQQSTDWISIDLSGGAEQFEVLKNAILNREAVRIEYVYPKGKSVRVIEPLQLVFRWGGWYLIAWCRLREDHRLFRLSRIRTAEGIGEGFTPKEVPMGMLLPDPNEPPMTLTVLAEPKLRYLLEEQGALVTDEMPDGRLKAQLQFASEKQCLAWALSLGSDVEVIEPQSVRQEIFRQARVILQRETQQQKQL